MMDERRALAAYYRQEREGGRLPMAAFPQWAQSVTYRARHYVVLGEPAYALAVYHVQPSGFLRRLKRWPKAVEAAAGLHNHERDETQAAQRCNT